MLRLHRPAYLESMIRRSPQAALDPDPPSEPAPRVAPHAGERLNLRALVLDAIGLVLALWALFFMWGIAS